MNKSLFKILLICGLLAPLIRLSNDLIAALLYPGYNILNQTMSELSAVGAPTRQFQLILFVIEDALIILFGIGVLISSGKKRSLRIVGALIVLLGILITVQLLIPQTSMQLQGSVADQIIHSVVIGGNVILILLYIGIGAASFGKGFRFYSIATILTMLVFGALAGAQASQAVGFSAPWMGVLERVNYYAYLAWMLVFAVILLRRDQSRASKENLKENK